MKKIRLFNDGGEETSDLGGDVALPPAENIDNQPFIPYLEDEGDEMM